MATINQTFLRLKEVNKNNKENIEKKLINLNLQYFGKIKVYLLSRQNYGIQKRLIIYLISHTI